MRRVHCLLLLSLICTLFVGVYPAHAQGCVGSTYGYGQPQFGYGQFPQFNPYQFQFQQPVTFSQWQPPQFYAQPAPQFYFPPPQISTYSACPGGVCPQQNNFNFGPRREFALGAELGFRRW